MGTPLHSWGASGGILQGQCRALRVRSLSGSPIRHLPGEAVPRHQHRRVSRDTERFRRNSGTAGFANEKHPRREQKKSSSV